MLEINQSHPTVFRIFNGNTCPAMILVFRITLVVIRNQCHIFYATIVNTSVPLISQQGRSSIVSIQSYGQRSIQCYLVAVYFTDCSVPSQIHVTFFPSQSTDTSSKDITTQRGNPFFAGRTGNHDAISFFQRNTRSNFQCSRVYRNIVGKHLQCVLHIQVVHSFHVDKRTSVYALFQQYCFFFIRTPQYNSGCGDTNTAGQGKFSLIE